MHPASAPAPQPHFGGGERRQVTVLFSDLAGATQLSTRLDAEDYRDVVAAYQRTAAAAVTRYGGHVSKYLGDGVLALFGYPRAHEDDAERAVRAGLAILDGVREIETGEADAPRLAARVGVHTAEAVIAGDGDDTADIFGEAPNVAARVQADADVGSLCITAETLRLLGDGFAVESRGTRTLKGISQPQTLYRVRHAVAPHERVQPDVAYGGTLVGRERERAVLLECWQRARAGRGGTVLISGEAGIGKTRLLHALREDLAGEEVSWLACETSAYHQHTDLHPIRSLLTAAAPGLIREDAGATPMNPDRYRERILSQVTDWVTRQARTQPTVLAIEDLHWADASTLAVVARLAAQAATLPLLLLLTSRPGVEAPVPAEHDLLTLSIGPLGEQETRAAVRARAPSDLLSDEAVEQIVARSDGVPLFIEELAHYFMEAEALGAPRSGDVAIPVTLQSLLMNRIDHLGAAKTVAQIGAVLGREFRADLLLGVAKLSADALAPSLAELEKAGVLVPAGPPQERRYAFRHALVRDAAYALLLRRARKALHRDTAAVLVKDFAAEAQQHPEIVAHHYEQADEHGSAARHWRRAARGGMTRGAYVEVVDHLRRALTALATAGEERSEEALVTHLLLGQALQATHGQEDAGAVESYAQARSLCAELADSPHLTRILTATYEVAVSQGAMHTAREVVAQMREIGLERNDPTLLTCAHVASGTTAFAAGDLLAAQEAFAEVARHHRPELQQRDFMTGFTARSYRPLLTWMLGHADEALLQCEQERQLALATEHPFVQAVVFNGIGLAHAFRGDLVATGETAAALGAIASANSYALFETSAACLLAIARLLAGASEAAVMELEAAVERIVLAGQRTWATPFQAFLAQGLCDTAAPERARTLLERALADDEERGHALFRAEFERLRAHALALQGASSEDVIAAYDAACATARRQGARAFELRAVVGLSRFRCARGDAEGAVSPLRSILGTWHEGGDTPDVVAAENLLRELR